MLLYLLKCEEYFSVIICTFFIIDCVQGIEFFHCNFYNIRLEKNHFGPKSILLCTNRKWGFLQWSGVKGSFRKEILTVFQIPEISPRRACFTSMMKKLMEKRRRRSHWVQPEDSAKRRRTKGNVTKSGLSWQIKAWCRWKPITSRSGH